MKINLASDKAVKEIALPAKGQVIVWDDGKAAARGFGLRITAGGAKSFILNYRVRGSGKERRYTIGSATDWTLAAARAHAKELRRQIDAGQDPLAELEEARKAAEDEKARARTVDQLCDEFERVHLPDLRPATQKFYRLQIKNHLKPAFGKKRVEDVERDDIEAVFRRLTKLGQLHAANQAVTISGVLFRYGIEWGWRTGANPTIGIKKHKLEGRERYLTDDETKGLLAAIDELEDRQAANIFTVLLYTGARIGETCAMRWQDLDFQRAVWRKPSAVTKQKKVHHVPLVPAVVAVLSKVRAEQKAPSEWVFPGKSKAGHRDDLRTSWDSVMKAAKITDLRRHDLRHSFASFLTDAGFSLPQIGKALGHATHETTARYSHLRDRAVREMMERGAAEIEAAATGKRVKDEKALLLARIAELEAKLAETGEEAEIVNLPNQRA